MKTRIRSESDRWQVFQEAFNDDGMLSGIRWIGWVERCVGAFHAHDGETGHRIGRYSTKASAIRALKRRCVEVM